MGAVARARVRWIRAVERARQRWPVVDYAWHTRRRYNEVSGGRLAAAMSYYGFFATFALGVVAFSVLGFLVEFHVDLRDMVDDFLAENLPVLDADQVSGARGPAGLLGLISLVLTGVAWVEALRSSQRLIWGLEQEPGSVVARRLGDVGVLTALAILLGASFALATGVEQLLDWLPAAVQTVLAWLLAIGVNLVLAVGLLAALPRVRMPARRLLPVALAVAIGLFVLNTVGGFYLDGVRQNPAYAAVAVAAGLLVYLYLLHQLLLLAASWAATTRLVG